MALVARGQRHGGTGLPSGLSNVEAVAAGAYHSLALRADGSMVGCGRRDDGQTNIPSGLNHVTAPWRVTVITWKSIAGGRLAGSVGRANDDRQLIGDSEWVLVRVMWWVSRLAIITAWRPASMVRWWAGAATTMARRMIPAGSAMRRPSWRAALPACALRGDGSVVGWGDDYYDQASDARGLSNVVTIAAGRNHCLALCGLPAGMAPPQPAGPSQVFATGDWPFRLRLLVKNGATSFGAAGLAAGLSLDPNTGLITGQPLETGTFAVTLSATNTAGSCTWTMTWL